MARKPGKYEDLNAYSKALTVSDFNTIYRTLAKRVNQRIVRLERSGAKMGNMAAVGYLEHIGRRRFKERTQFTEFSDFATIRKEITIMQGFLASDRSTKSGRKRILEKTGNTFASKHGLDLNNETLDSFLTDFEDTKAAASMASDMIVSILASVTNEKTKSEKVDEIIKEIVNASSVREAASNVAALEGVNKSAGEILADILGKRLGKRS